MKTLTIHLSLALTILGAATLSQAQQWRSDQRDLQVERNRSRTQLRAQEAAKSEAEAGNIFYVKGQYAGSHRKSGWLGTLSVEHGPHLGSGQKDYDHSIGLSAQYLSYDANATKVWFGHADYQLNSDRDDWVTVLKVDAAFPDKNRTTWNPGVSFSAAHGASVLTLTPGYEVSSKSDQTLTGEALFQYNLNDSLALYTYYAVPNGQDPESQGFGLNYSFINFGGHPVTLLAESGVNRSYLLGLKVRF